MRRCHDDARRAASDFYGLERTLEPSELAVLHAVRAFMRDEVEPIINDYWTRAKFPFQHRHQRVRLT